VESEHVYRVSKLGVLVHNPECYREGWFPGADYSGNRPVGEDWSFGHPAGNPGFAGDHGVPMPPGADPTRPDWMVGGHLTPDAPGVSAGPSIGIPPNDGGAVEGSVAPGGV